MAIEHKCKTDEELQEVPIAEEKEYDLSDLFNRLAQSSFRSRFHLLRKGRTISP